MNRSYHLRCGAVVLVLTCTSRVLGAQPVPTATQCTVWSHQLRSGGAGAVDALHFGWFAGCPSTGPTDLAYAITSSAVVTDTAYLWALVRQAGALAHPTVFGAAIANANTAASTQSRSASLLILVAQLGFAPHLTGYVPFSELSVDIPATGLCGPELSFYAPPGPAVRGLPSNYRRQVAALFDALHTSSAPDRVRNLARCLRIVIGEIPPQVDISGVTLRYVRCNTFVIDNPTAFRLPMGVDVLQTGEHFGWSAEPGHSEFSTGAVGTVSLTYDGIVIRTAAHGGLSC